MPGDPSLRGEIVQLFLIRRVVHKFCPETADDSSNLTELAPTFGGIASRRHRDGVKVRDRAAPGPAARAGAVPVAATGLDSQKIGPNHHRDG